MKVRTIAIVAGCALLGILLIARPAYRGERITEVATDGHRRVCMRTSRELRVASYRSLAHGRGYDTLRFKPRQWIADAGGTRLRFDRDLIGACTPLLDGVGMREERAAGPSPAGWGLHPGAAAPGVRLDALPDRDDREVVVCRQRADGVQERCKRVDVTTLDR